MAQAQAEIKVTNIEKIREKLLTTSSDWLKDYNHPKHYPKANGVCKKTHRFELACLGGNFSCRITDAYADRATFTCNYTKCDASILVYGQENTFRSLQKNVETSIQWSIELATVHSNQCAISVRQVKVLRYLSALKMYLSDPNNSLRSNLGLYLCHEISAQYPDLTVIVTMDHLIETKSKNNGQLSLLCWMLWTGNKDIPRNCNMRFGEQQQRPFTAVQSKSIWFF